MDHHPLGPVPRPAIHVGNLRTALRTILIARKNGGEFHPADRTTPNPGWARLARKN